MAGWWRKARWRICGARPAPVTPPWKTPSSPWSTPTAPRAPSPHDQGRHGRLVRAARDAAGLAGLGLVVVGRASPARLYRGAGARRVRRADARARLSDIGPLDGFCRRAGQAPLGDGRRNPAALWVLDAVAGDGGGDPGLLRPRRPRPDPVVIGQRWAAVRGAHC